MTKDIKYNSIVCRAADANMMHSFCLDPYFYTWLHLQASMFGTVVSGS